MTVLLSLLSASCYIGRLGVVLWPAGGRVSVPSHVLWPPVIRRRGCQMVICMLLGQYFGNISEGVDWLLLGRPHSPFGGR